ncbi:MAG: hypothetical protein RLZZ398_2093 [Verrucomicrobiota bacterium]|jgi:hypothetical protein
MAKIYRIELDEHDLGQLLDGLEIRADSWRRTAEYLRAGDMPDGEFFIIEECSDEDEAEAIAADYGRIIGILMEQRDSQAMTCSGGGSGEEACRMNEAFYMIVGESVVEGLQPTVMVSEGDSPFEPLLFPTEREAQMEMADRMMSKLEEFIDGERDFDDAVALDEHVLEVVRRGDGKIFPKDYAMPPGFGGW